MRRYTINQAIEHAREKLGLSWDDNRQRLAFYDYVNDFLDKHAYKSIQDKLEEIKLLGYYAVGFSYGEDIGCDDLDVSQYERNIRLIATPVGCVGEARVMYIGKLREFLIFDFTQNPIQISNPPKREEYEKKNVFYIWGTDNGVKAAKRKSANLTPKGKE